MLPYYPLFRLAICFILGILCAEYIGRSFFGNCPFVIAFILFLTIIFLNRKLKYRRQWLCGILIGLLCFMLGYIRTVQSESHHHRQHFSQQTSPTYYLAEIVEQPSEKKKSIKLILEIFECGNINRKTTPCTGKLLSYIAKDSISKRLRCGDRIIFSSGIHPVETAKNPYAFDYAKHLKHQEIYHQTYISALHWQQLNGSGKHFLKRKSLEWQSKCLAIIRMSGLKNQELSVASALLFGASGSLESELKQSYQHVGVIHILCVSGLHVGLFAMVLSKLLAFLKYNRLQKAIRLLIILSGIWLYACITGLAPSILRAAVMFSFVAVGQHLHKNTSIYNSLAVSALLLLVINPNILFSIGFQLSYLAVIGIVIFEKHIKSIFSFKHKITKYIWELTAVSMAAQLITTPLSVYYFHQFPNYFILANLIASPISVVVIPLGMLVIGSSFVSMFAAKCFAWLLSKSIFLLNFSVIQIEKFPGSVMQGIDLNVFGVLCLYLLLLFFLLLLIRKRKQHIFLMLSCMLIFLCSTFLLKIHCKNQSSIHIYHLPKESLLVYLKGNQAIIYSHAAYPVIQAQIKNQCIRQHIESMELIDLQKMHFLTPGSQRIYIVNSQNAQKKYKNKLSMDILWLQGSPKISIHELLKYYRPKIIVIDGSNHRQCIRQWKSESIPKDVKLHITAETGAYNLHV